MKDRNITLHINGEAHSLTVTVNRTLLDVLRDELGMTETKYGCGTGECGACTVLVEGKAVNSCLTLAATMDGKRITTVAGLSDFGRLDHIQQAFVDEAAIQCGYCTPGMVMKTASLLAKNPDPSEAEIRHALEGNICRCTGYEKIVKAVKKAAQTMPGRAAAVEPCKEAVQ
ncbi:2Fe-2S iron-sulfur cluster binding domain-containing protein [Aromatoleum toluvorans]|uniref:2Fe-2S iron-sulfur cluster binding domain-containing protein n=1 Tax=Aromatoleum toluvorans TaxID=92002 RepID=A0ABX1Q0D7_9RHOO|nr:(2Fe-2S)-binding protein [Aromatoleum toluvorans]NMG43821.1 2Fe-2S iron-sulfur cluster binding domain-containing protein [Aromatoleum toluvorans]